MEFKITPLKRPEPIRWNYTELKAELIEKVGFYETLVYTDDQIKDAKADRANLNKLKKALNDERLRLQREYMEPFDEFKRQVDDLIATIDKPAAMIDKQVKAYEESKRAEKEKEIRDYLVGFKLPFGIDPQRLFETRWLNATASMKTIKDELMEKLKKIEGDAQAIAGIEEYQDQAIRAYQERLDLGDAMRAAQTAKETEEKIRAWRAEMEAKKAEPKPLPEIKVNTEPLAGQWVNFSAWLTLEDAKALKQFFTDRGIQFRRIP